MTQRTGVPSLLIVARELCRLITKFTPVIQRLYPENGAILLALESANLACAALAEQLVEIREFGT